MNFEGPTLAHFSYLFAIPNSKIDYFSSNLNKEALPWGLRPILGHNNFISPKRVVKSHGKAPFLRLELNMYRSCKSLV